MCKIGSAGAPGAATATFSSSFLPPRVPDAAPRLSQWSSSGSLSAARVYFERGTSKTVTVLFTSSILFSRCFGVFLPSVLSSERNAFRFLNLRVIFVIIIFVENKIPNTRRVFAKIRSTTECTRRCSIRSIRCLMLNRGRRSRVPFNLRLTRIAHGGQGSRGLSRGKSIVFFPFDSSCKGSSREKSTSFNSKRRYQKRRVVGYWQRSNRPTTIYPRDCPKAIDQRSIVPSKSVLVRGSSPIRDIQDSTERFIETEAVQRAPGINPSSKSFSN